MRRTAAALFAFTAAALAQPWRGALAPDFTATDVAGKAFRLADCRGRIVVLDFWGFW